jgi:aminoglycoside/choline kinase family phosphotransferase
LPDESVGVIDFQDAVVGPLTYDLVSLLRDCYLVFPNSVVSALIEYFYQQAQSKGVVATNISLAEFTRWFDWMGLQRHIKVLGIFARLAYRDGKFGYLDDIPRVFDYVIEVSGRYAELESFQQWMLHTVKPLLLEKSKEKSNG